MRVTVRVSTPGGVLPETYTVDMSAEGSHPTIEDVARHLMINGLVVGNRWISPFRILEFEPVPVPMKLKEGE
jgi:hypothetical protein